MLLQARQTSLLNAFTVEFTSALIREHRRVRSWQFSAVDAAMQVQTGKLG
jgi:hypothetical protein